MSGSDENVFGVKKDNYPGLPDVLKKFNYYYQDGGHVIMAIPECLLNKAIQNGKLDQFECSIPCKYVLEQGFRIYENHVIVDCGYDEFLGIVVDSSYYEYDNAPTDTQEKPEFVKTEIGEPFFITFNQEGMYFDTTETGTILIVGFNSPTQKEVEQFKSSVKSEFRLSVVDDVLFLLAKIGSLNWMDASYNPSVASSLKPLSFDILDGMGMQMWIYLVDSRTNILKAQRLIGLGTKFSKDFQCMANEILAKGRTVSDFNCRLQNVYRRYTTKDLLKFSTSYYKTGEI